MPSIPAYRTQVASPVGKAVNVTAPTGTAQGLASLGDAIQNTSAQVGTVLSNAVYSHEMAKEQLDFQNFRNEYLEAQKTQPLIQASAVPEATDTPTGTESQMRLLEPEGGLGGVTKHMETSWEDAYNEYMEGRKNYISHGRAQQDFGNWAKSQYEETRSIITNKAIDDSIAFMNQMSLQSTQDLIDNKQFEEARAEVTRAYNSGVLDEATAALRSNLIDEAETYDGLKTQVFETGYTDAEGNPLLDSENNPIKGYSEYANHIDGLDAAYATIDALDASDANKDKLRAEAEAQYQDDAFVETKRKEAANEAAFDYFGVAIETGAYPDGRTPTLEQMKYDIANDPQLNASTRIKLFDRLKGKVGSASSALDVKMESIAVDVFSNPNYTKEMVDQELGRLLRSGDIDEAVYMKYIAKSRPDEIIMPAIRSGHSRISGVWDSMIADEKDPAKKAELQGQKDRALLTFSEQVSDNENLTDENIETITNNIIGMMLQGELEAGSPFKDEKFSRGGLFDTFEQSDFETIVSARASGQREGMQRFGGSLQENAILEAEGKRILLENYSHAITAINDVKWSADGKYMLFYTNTYGGIKEDVYRFAPSRNGHEVVLEKYEKGEFVASQLSTDRDYDNELAALRKDLDEQEFQAIQEEEISQEVRAREMETYGSMEGKTLYNGFPDFILRSTPSNARRLANIYDITPSQSGILQDINDGRIEYTIEKMNEKSGRRIFNKVDENTIRNELRRLHYPEDLIESAITDVMAGMNNE